MNITIFRDAFNLGLVHLNLPALLIFPGSNPECISHLGMNFQIFFYSGKSLVINYLL